MAGAISKMVRNLKNVDKDGNEAGKAFQSLGVSTKDANGNLRDSEAIFNDTIAALGKIPNETERDIVAMAIFGKSAQDLNPLINTSAGELENLTKKAHEMGAVMSEEDVEAAANFQDTLDGLKMGLQGTLGTLSGAFMPGLQGLAETAGGYLKDLVGIVKGSNGDIGQAAGGIGKLIGTIFGDVAKQAPELLKAGLGIIQGLIQAIVDNLPQMVQAAIEIVLSIANFILANLPMLIKAAIDIIVTLALGIAQALPKLIPEIAKIIPQIITILVENLPLLIDAALKLILALVEGLITALPILIESIPQIVTAIFNALIAALPMIGDAAVKLVLMLIDGIGGMLPQIGKAAGDLINALVKGVTALGSKIGEVGKNIVLGVWEGIKAKASWFSDQVKQFFANIVQGVKDALLMKSPSKVFADIGSNMAAGLGIGFFRELQQFQKAVNGMAGSGFGLQPVLAGSGGDFTQNSDAYQFYGPVYIQGSTGQSFGETVKAKRWCPTPTPPQIKDNLEREEKGKKC